MRLKGSGSAIGIDLAVAAKHRVALRGEESDDFTVAHTLAGMVRLTERLAARAPAVVVAEPTAMSWLAVGHAVEAAGCELSLIQARHSAKLRGRSPGRTKPM